jgi:DNA ligase (NAD+)
MKLVELESKIKKYAQDYYDGHPTISDDAFDALVDELRKTDPDNQLLKVPGWGYTPLGKKFTHYITPIGSLGKIKYVELNDKVNILPDYFRVEPKFDGGSAVCYYEGGKLVRVLSRGDGIIGVDITQNLLHAVPSTIPYNKKLAIRGEIVITIEDFAKMQGYTSPRNAAVGLSQSEHVDKNLVKNLRFIACEIIGYEDEDVIGDKDVTEEFEWVIDRAKTNPKAFQNYVANMKDFPKTTKLDDGKHVQIDGWVLKSFSFITTQQGSWTKTERSFQIAFKFQEEQAVTTVKDIEYTVSRTGRVVPVWLVEPIQLAGATISRVTANNWAYLKNTKAGVGAEISIIRSNEVIPCLMDVLTPSYDFRSPEKCPYCGTLLVEKGVDLFCPNNDCKPKSIEMIYRIIELVAEKVNLEGIGRELIDRLLEYPPIESFVDFDVFVHEGIYAHMVPQVFGENSKTTEKFYRVFSMLEEFIPTIPEVLNIANIPTIGSKVSENYGNIENLEFIRVFYNKEQLPKEWEKHSVNYLNFTNLETYRNKIFQVMEFCGWELQQKAIKVDGVDWVVCVTGPVRIPRDKWYKVMEKFGVKQGGVSKNTTFLLSNDTTSSSSKFKTAQKLNVPIITEQDFYQKLSEASKIPIQDILNTF